MLEVGRRDLRGGAREERRDGGRVNPGPTLQALSPALQELILAAVKVALIIPALQGVFSLMTWIERRVLAFMQFRLGPNRTGPFGLLQPIADGIKLFFKEELMPAAANKWAFLAAPVVAVTTSFLAVAVLPFGPPFKLPTWGFLPEWLQGRDFQFQIATIDVGLLFIFAITALGVYGVVLAGWAANNKYSMLGALRSSAQMFSYELALGLSFVTVIMLAGSFQIGDIVGSQMTRAGGWFLGWNCFVQFPAFLVYFVAAAAEVARTPFDLPEGETELVAGFHTEYSSMRFALIQMAEYVNMITVTVLATNLFLGGWHSGIPGVPSEGLLGFVFWGAKVAFLLFVFIWLRGTLPRFRYDQLMHFGWKVLIPVAAVWIFVTAAGVALAGW
jgi:NADH-quinone oxidoreductase subunit H